MTARPPTMVTLHDTGFLECRWWNEGWTVKTRQLTVVGLHDTGVRRTDPPKTPEVNRHIRSACQSLQPVTALGTCVEKHLEHFE